MDVKQYVTDLAKKAGIKEDNELLKTYIEDEEATGVPDELAKKIDVGLAMLSVESAKNNPDLQKFFKAEVLNGVDARLKKSFDEVGLSDEAKNKILANENTFERVALLASEVKNAYETRIKELKDSGITDDKIKEQINSYKKEIENLNVQVKNAQEQSDGKINELTKAHSQQIADLKLKTILAGYNYANKEVPAEVNILTAQTLLKQKLAENGWKIDLNDGELALKTKDNADVYDQNEKITLGSYIESCLGNNKLLAVNSSPNPKQPNGLEGRPGDKASDISLANENSLKEYLAGSKTA